MHATNKLLLRCKGSDRQSACITANSSPFRRFSWCGYIAVWCLYRQIYDHTAIDHYPMSLSFDMQRRTSTSVPNSSPSSRRHFGYFLSRSFLVWYVLHVLRAPMASKRRRFPRTGEFATRASLTGGGVGAGSQCGERGTWAREVSGPFAFGFG